MKDKIKAIMRRDLMPFPNRQDNLEYTQEDVILIAETFAKEYLKEQLLIQRVSQQRELLEAYQDFIDWNEEHDRKASTGVRIDAFLASNCG